MRSDVYGPLVHRPAVRRRPVIARRRAPARFRLRASAAVLTAAAPD
ncbi:MULTISPECIES: hypothetical protein [unclassified Streptomyces]|nr:MULTISPECIES: hypothetical protein [unclassified Streptomyces]MCH0558543.1 hypothetical protein [Streptomyces sp. MUM 16J]